jgi:hypothetical protein
MASADMASDAAGVCRPTRAAGYDCDLVSFMLFGELDVAQTGNVSSAAQEAPDVITETTHCGWLVA